MYERVKVVSNIGNRINWRIYFKHVEETINHNIIKIQNCKGAGINIITYHLNIIDHQHTLALERCD